ncbi:unnamed protein product [Cuscuta campestris]|uniref:Retrotransposon Copia-like N-terminal domain-containing protein n=1 Tax=Cuscuta campestris TaxID=132261 RepID=A0A484N398_9ASTE|nr:unnamed protein product [Cuscuta campestris]
MAENSEITSQNNSSKPPHLAFTTFSNVKLHVPVPLSLSQPNYKKWSRLFLLLVRRFNLKGYIDGSVVPLSDDDDEWFQLDALLQGWILSTITNEASDLVISSVSTASALWKVIHDLFHDNKHARAMQLEHEFRTTVKGNSTMAAYCQQRQNLVDWLDDVDAPVSQHQLVLQMLRGLPADLQAQTSFMQFQDPMPMFLQEKQGVRDGERTQKIYLGFSLSSFLSVIHLFRRSRGNFMESQALVALGLSMLGGLSTSLGALFVIINPAPDLKMLGLLQGFAAGLMLSISFLDLAHNALNSIGFLRGNLWFFAGAAFFALISSFIPEPTLSPISDAQNKMV